MTDSRVRPSYFSNRAATKPKGQVREIGSFDYTILLVVSFLVLIGVIMVFSASHMIAANRQVFGNDPYYFLRRNGVFAAIGFTVMMAASFVSYEYLRKWARVMYVVSLGLLAFVLIGGFAAGGHQRWIEIPIIGQFQPSELARATVVFIMAYGVEKFPNALSTWGGFFRACGVVGIVVVLIYIPGGFSTALIAASIGFGMIFIASPFFWRYVLVGGGLAGAIAGYLWYQLTFGGGAGAFRGARVSAWIDPFSDPLGVGFQTIQSLYAIASGGLLGLGIGNSRQASFIPEPHNDIIFAIIVEELGLIGAGLILVLFGVLIWRGVIVALNAPDTFSSMAAIGIVLAFAVPTIINIAVVTNSIPNTGVNLPFISYGGTSLMVSMALAGVLLNISRYAKRDYT